MSDYDDNTFILIVHISFLQNTLLITPSINRSLLNFILSSNYIKNILEHNMLRFARKVPFWQLANGYEIIE